MTLMLLSSRKTTKQIFTLFESPVTTSSLFVHPFSLTFVPSRRADN